MILEIPYGDSLWDLVVKCANYRYERYFECQNWSVMFFVHLKEMSCCILQHETFIWSMYLETLYFGSHAKQMALTGRTSHSFIEHRYRKVT